jgi:tripartite ATP-independent transporter DctP family solute receptor
MKKLSIVLLLTVVLLPMVFAQGGAEKASSKEVMELQIAHDNHPGDPLTVACEYWAEILEERSNGTMVLKTYPSGQLGSKNDLIDQMYAGDPIMVVVNGPYAADRGVADLGIMQAPYLFTNWSQLRKLMDSEWGDSQKEQLRDIGMQVVADNWQYGARHTLTVKPVKTPADLQGMKIRTQGSTIHVEGFRVLGANPTPMTLSEVYTSLQQGVIEGLENPISVLYSGKFHEVAKNLMLDGHIYDLSFIVIGTGVFDSLTAEQQELLIETGLEAGRKQNELAAAADKKFLDQMVAEGVVINDIDVMEFQEAAASFYENSAITSKWSPNLFETVQSIISE